MGILQTLFGVLALILCFLGAKGQEVILEARFSRPGNVTLSGSIGEQCVKAFDGWNVAQFKAATHRDLLDPLSSLLDDKRHIGIGDMFPLGDQALNLWLSQLGQVRFGHPWTARKRIVRELLVDFLLQSRTDSSD